MGVLSESGLALGELGAGQSARASRRSRARWSVCVGYAVSVVLQGCSGLPGQAPLGVEPPSANPAPAESMATPAPVTPPPPSVDEETIRALVDESVAARGVEMERELARMRVDLAAAEQALVDRESGTRADRSRADAVTRIAEARIRVEHASKEARWLVDDVALAQTQLGRASAQLEAEHFSAAILFAESATRTADASLALAAEADALEGAREVSAQRVNLRAGPSTDDAVLATLAEGTPIVPEREGDGWLLVRTALGQRGWIRGDLVR